MTGKVGRKRLDAVKSLSLPSRIVEEMCLDKNLKEDVCCNCQYPGDKNFLDTDIRLVSFPFNSFNKCRIVLCSTLQLYMVQPTNHSETS